MIVHKSYLDPSLKSIWKIYLLLELCDLVKLRWKSLVSLNLFFFGCLLIAVVFAGYELQTPVALDWHPSILGDLSGTGWIGMVFGIFVFNLIIGGFLAATLSGILFFPLPIGFLAYHAFSLGLTLWALPSSVFWPTMVAFFIEGEAYVFGALGGVLVGMSWTMANWIYNREQISRTAAIRKSMRELAYFYLVAVVLLLGAATIEALTFFLG